MNSDTRWGIHYNQSSIASARYYEIYSGAPDNIATLPGETDRIVALGEMDITIDSTDGGFDSAARSFWLSFDGWGKPYFRIVEGSPDPQASNPIQLTLSKPGHGTEQLTITQNTGFIP